MKVKSHHYYLSRWTSFNDANEIVIRTGAISSEEWIKIKFFYNFLCDISLTILIFEIHRPYMWRMALSTTCALHNRTICIEDDVIIICEQFVCENSVWNIIPKTDRNQEFARSFYPACPDSLHIWFRSTKYYLHFAPSNMPSGWLLCCECVNSILCPPSNKWILSSLHGCAHIIIIIISRSLILHKNH